MRGFMSLPHRAINSMPPPGLNKEGRLLEEREAWLVSSAHKPQTETES
jgi:hypothetical protein